MLHVRRSLPISLAILFGTLAASTLPAESTGETEAETPAASKERQDAIDTFMSSIQSLCNQAFEGRIVANEPAAPNDPFAGKKLVMHVLACKPAEVRIPFHVGDDHSRTWVITRAGGALRLKHDHRHEDGTEDALTQYGGDTTAPGTAVRQEFPADAHSRALFQKQGIVASTANVWAIELEGGRRLVYELARPGRLFRVEFDLTRRVETPPMPWGYAPGCGTPRSQASQ